MITHPNDAAFAFDHNTGLTKREYFAAMAMQGILANQSRTIMFSNLGRESVAAADALIQELNKSDKS